jgi:predicted transcriptional regulator
MGVGNNIDTLLPYLRKLKQFTSLDIENYLGGDDTTRNNGLQYLKKHNMVVQIGWTIPPGKTKPYQLFELTEKYK